MKGRLFIPGFGKALIPLLLTLASPVVAGLSEPWLPVRGPTLQDEIKCYSLPYGGIGFASHALTYYTLLMLSAGRSPWRFKELTATKFDTALAVIQLVGTVAMASFTIARCRDRWEFVLIAVWKLLFSLEVSVWAMVAAFVADEEELGWFVASVFTGIYFIPVVIGATGLIALVAHTIKEPLVWKITVAFGTPMALLIFVFLILCVRHFGTDDEENIWMFGGVTG